LSSSSSPVVQLPRGATNVDVLRLLGSESMRSKRLIRLSDAEGLYGGWVLKDDPEFARQATAFKTMESFFLLGGDWCCSSRRANDGRLYPVDPPQLPKAGASSSWLARLSGD
jgi:hypothetical protein